MSIKLSHINYSYNKNSDFEIKALDNISFEIPDGQFVGLIGHTGSGKSTLIQHLNGLLKADSGELFYNGENIYDKKYDMKSLRFQVGLVFQYPDHQLFDETVLKDVSFGPRNQKVPKEECIKRAKDALKLVGIGEEYYNLPPFDLSGGQKKRVTIAGAIAMQPKVLVLDEPTAGLDPRGRDEILDQIQSLHKETNMTVILVSHSMEDVARYVDRVIVMDQGKIFQDGAPKDVFLHYKELEKMGLAAPQVTYIMQALKEKGMDVNERIITVEEAVKEIKRVFGEKL